LALALGRTVGEIEQIPYAEFLEWQEYFSLEPFGEFAADLRHGHHLSVLANINRDTRKVRKPYEAKDFCLWAGKKEEKYTLDADQQTERMIARQFSGLKVIRADQ